MKRFRDLAVACGLALALALPAVPAFAQGAQPVELSGDVKVERIITEEGKERRVLEKPETVVPGDKLVFTTNYHNTGTEVVTDFVVTNPLPQPVRLSAEDAAAVELSVDGGKSWGKLADLTVTDEAGVKRAAGIDDVTHLRWTIASVPPGAKGAVTYSGTVR